MFADSYVAYPRYLSYLVANRHEGTMSIISFGWESWTNVLTIEMDKCIDRHNLNQRNIIRGNELRTAIAKSWTDCAALQKWR